MLDKPDPPDTALFALPDHVVVALHGRDALAFAHAQFMSDVTALGDGDWQWSGWLSPKGRVLALFAVLRLGPEQVWLLLADDGAAALVAGLRGFVFRSKVAISIVEDRVVLGAFDRPAATTAPARAAIGDAGVTLDFSGDGGPRMLRVGAGGGRSSAADVARWHAFDLAHGWPRLPPSQLGKWTPQQLSLDRLQAYSVRKGCYPGQEIVARTHFLGQAKRGLALLQSPAPLLPDADVRRGGQVVGSVACASADGSLALAVLTLDEDRAPLESGGHALVRVPLLAGLAR